MLEFENEIIRDAVVKSYLEEVKSVELISEKYNLTTRTIYNYLKNANVDRKFEELYGHPRNILIHTCIEKNLSFKEYADILKNVIADYINYTPTKIIANKYNLTLVKVQRIVKEVYRPPKEKPKNIKLPIVKSNKGNEPKLDTESYKKCRGLISTDTSLTYCQNDDMYNKDYCNKCSDIFLKKRKNAKQIQ